MLLGENLLEKNSFIGANSPESVRAYLLLLDPGALESNQVGRRFLIPERGLVVGTDPLSDIPLWPSAFHKPSHVRVWRDPGENWRFRHIEEDDAIYLNQRPCQQGFLKDGDILQIGASVFEFLLETGLRFRVYQEMEARVRLDQLTRIQNRKSMIEQIEREMSRLSRDPKEVFSLVLFNLDHFAEINLAYGYHGGDEVLKTVARRLELGLRKHELVGRYSGEEFLILLPGISRERVSSIADILRMRVQSQPVHFLGQTIPITLSGGTATAAEVMSLHQLLQLAEDRLSQAKENGRNRVIA